MFMATAQTARCGPDTCQVGERRARCLAEELAPKATCVTLRTERQTRHGHQGRPAALHVRLVGGQ